eukprot:9291705-Pyramimonas_sp.AAC.1
MLYPRSLSKVESTSGQTSGVQPVVGGLTMTGTATTLLRDWHKATQCAGYATGTNTVPSSGYAGGTVTSRHQGGCGCYRHQGGLYRFCVAAGALQCGGCYRHRGGCYRHLRGLYRYLAVYTLLHMCSHVTLYGFEGGGGRSAAAAPKGATHSPYKYFGWGKQVEYHRHDMALERQLYQAMAATG